MILTIAYFRMAMATAAMDCRWGFIDAYESAAYPDLDFRSTRSDASGECLSGMGDAGHFGGHRDWVLGDVARRPTKDSLENGLDKLHHCAGIYYGRYLCACG